MSFSDRAGAWIDAHPKVRDWIQTKLGGYPPAWLNDRTLLADWAEMHAISTSDVWAVSPPYGDLWRLWAPGSFVYGTPGPQADVYREIPDVDPTNPDIPRLVEVESWMRPWVEEVTGSRVVEMADGLWWWGDGPVDYDFRIFVRVAS